MTRRFWLMPLLLALTYLFVLTAFFPGWTWSMFDELYWVVRFRENIGLSDWTKSDFVTHGRVRPLSAVFVFVKMHLLGLDAHLLKIVRASEFILAAGLAILYLRHSLPLLFAVFGVAFWLKSPPQLEQFNWMTLSELNGTILLLLGLIAYKRSRMAGYGLLVLAALTKEPFIFFLPLPALLEKKRAETVVGGTLAAAFLVFLLYNRRSYTADVSVESLRLISLREIVRGYSIDFTPVAPLLLLFIKRMKVSEELWKAAVLSVFAALYAVSVLPKAWGYTYIFSPAILLAALALAFLMGHFSRVKALPRWALLYVGALVVLFSARVCWNVTKVYLKSHARNAVAEAIKDGRNKGAVVTNCAFDTRGLGYMADGRQDDKLCSASATECCKGSGLFALGIECDGFDTLSSELSGRGAYLILTNRYWRLFECK